MFVASKYEEMYCPEVADFVYVTDHAFTKAQVLLMEQMIPSSLNILCLHTFSGASKAANVS